MMKRLVAAAALLLAAASAGAADPALPGPAAELYKRAQAGRWHADAAKLNPDIRPTSDGRSFVVVWKPAGANPSRWLVTLHGSRGFATDDLALWQRALDGREVGIVALQWWIGQDDSTPSYYPPLAIYRELDQALAKLGVAPGSAMLHGFSRGAANSYPVAAIDAGRGRKYFSVVVASSGGVADNYPPVRALLAGEYGHRPLRGTRWITAAGDRDESPERDGIPAMRRTASWLEEQGATVLARIEDPAQGHGALMTNPANARRALDIFLSR